MRRSVGIAGAGPAGLATALLLHRDGHAVTIFERFDAPRPLGSGIILQPTGQRVLERLGLMEGVRKLATPIHRLVGQDSRTGRTVLDVRYDALSGGVFGYGIHRGALFALLHRAVEETGIAIETRRHVTDIEASSGGSRLVFADGGRSAGFDLLVDASGARSQLLRHATRRFTARELPWGAIWSSLEWRDGFAEDVLTQRYQRASVMIGVLPIGRVEPDGGRQAAFFWSLKPDSFASLKAAGLDAWKDRVLQVWPQTATHLDQILDWDQVTLARYGHHTLPTPAGRNVAFVGDSAHSTSPQLGQGANMALLDAAALSDALRQHDDPDQALAAYCRRRRWHVRLYQALSAVFTPFYQSDSRALPVIRDTAMAIACRTPPGPRLLASMVAGGWGFRTG